jgi:hypothetical protein
MKKQLDMAKIAKGLGALRRGKVHAKGGYLGALGLAAELSKTTDQVSEEDAEGLIRQGTCEGVRGNAQPS